MRFSATLGRCRHTTIGQRIDDAQADGYRSPDSRSLAGSAQEPKSRPLVVPGVLGRGSAMLVLITKES